jgi:holliday junction DNA helicase RuvA
VISRLRGTLLSREGEQVEVATPGGVVYQVEIPLSVAEGLPRVGEELELRTLHVVREDLTALYGFLEAGERQLFARLIGAKGVGAKLALAMLSTFSAPRLARALVEKDVAALVQVSGVGKKTAERIVLELSDRVKELDLAPETGDAGAPPQPAHAAVQALMALGMGFAAADRAVRAVLEEDGATSDTGILVRKALARR